MPRYLLPVLALSALHSYAVAQTTWYVDINAVPPGTGTLVDPYTSLQYAIAQVATLSGDTLLVSPGTYAELIDFSGKDLVVQSTAGAATTILDGAGSGPVVRFVSGETAAAALDGFTVMNGDSRIANPADDLGGGVHCDGASPTLLNLIVHTNQSHRGGGLQFRGGSTATLTDSVVRDNNMLISHGSVGSSEGGGVWSSCDSLPSVLRCDFLRNARARGGGAWGSGIYRECLFEANNGFDGAGLFAPVACTLEVHDSVIRGGNTCIDGDCGRGGGVFGPAQVFDSVIEDNFAVRSGGGAEGATLTRCVLQRNRALPLSSFGGTGGGASGSTLVECQVLDNQAVGTNAIFAGSRGGGIHLGSATDCVIRGNLAQFGAGGGASSATLLRCEVVENEATQTDMGTPSGGGGLVDCTAERCFVWKNRAGRGGGVQNGSTIHCVVYRNTAILSNGGVQAGNPFNVGNAFVKNSVVWENDGPQMLQTNGTVNALYTDAQGGWIGFGNFDAFPLFWQPETGDVHLKPGSPCINTGDPMSPLDPDGSRADVGVYSFRPAYCGLPQPFCEAKVNSQGCLPAIGSTGSPSMSGPDDFFVTATLVRNAKIGTLFYSTSPAFLPAFGGTLCAAPAVVRVASQDSGGSPPATQDCTGSYAFPMTQQRMTNLGMGWSLTVYFQIVYRDPPHPDGTGVGLTDGLETTICQ